MVRGEGCHVREGCDECCDSLADEEVDGSDSDEPGLDYLQQELGSVSLLP